MQRRRILVLTILVIFCFGTSPFPANAETISGAIYSGAYRAFAGDNCQAGAKSAGDPACSAGLAAQAAAQLSEIGQTKVYQDLAALQNERIQCGIKKQQSLTSSPEAMRAAKDRINRALPVLSALKKQVGAIVAQWQVLRGSVPQNKISNPDPFAAKRRQLDEMNTLAKTLTADYERQLASLLQTEDIGNREFIEDHMAGLYSGVKLLSDADFKDLQKKVSDNLAENSRDLTAGASTFSNKLRNSLSQDADLIGVYLNKNPESQIGVERLQCVAHQRIAGEKGVDAALTVGSFALPVGALGMARAARIAYVARIPRAASTFTKTGKGFGYSAMVIGSLQTAAQLYERCGPQVTASVKGNGNACSVSAESILADEQETSCVTSGLWAASPVLGKFALGLLAKVQKDLGNLPQHEKDLAKFVEDHKGDMRRQDLVAVDRLLENDIDRVRVTERILGRSKPFSKKESDGLIAAHNVGKGPVYSAAEIEEKKRILTEAGFGWRERTIMLHKGLAGRFAGLTDEARLAEVKAYDKTNLSTVKDWAEHYNVGAQIELLRDSPDPEKFRKAIMKAIDSRVDKYWRADRNKLPNELLKGMSDDFALLGSISRGNPKLFATARQNYIDTVKLKMRKIEKEGGDAKAWLKTELAGKKAGGGAGPLGEMQKFESEVLTDVTAMIEKDPKFVNVTMDQASFQKSKIEDAITQAKADVDKAVKEGPPVTDTAVANAGVIDSAPGTVSSASAALPPASPTASLVRASTEDPGAFERRSKLATEYHKWSGGDTLTDAQSVYLQRKAQNLSSGDTWTDLRRLGMSDDRIRFLELNKFEYGSAKTPFKPASAEIVQRARSNYRDDLILHSPSPQSAKEAQELAQKAYQLKPVNPRSYTQTALETDIKERMLAQIKEMTDHIPNLTKKLTEAKTLDEIHAFSEARKVHAERCRKLWAAFKATGILHNSDRGAELDKATSTGICRY